MRTAIIFRFFFLLCQKRDVRGVRKEDKVMVMEKIDILRLLQFSCLIDNYLCTFLWIRNIFVTTHSIHLSFSIFPKSVCNKMSPGKPNDIYYCNSMNLRNKWTI